MRNLMEFGQAKTSITDDYSASGQQGVSWQITNYEIPSKYSSSSLSCMDFHMSGSHSSVHPQVPTSELCP